MNTMSDQIDLTELSRIEQAATAAPWMYRPSMFDDWGVIRGGDHSPVATSCMECRYAHTTDVGKPEGPSPIPQNGELIVAMRNALPGIIAELTELRAENAALRKRCNNMHHAFIHGFMSEKGNPEKVVCEIIANGYSSEAGQFRDGRHLR